MISQARFKLALCLAVLAFLALPAAARAQSIIKQPGNHPDYGFELEPHLAFQWAGRYGSGDGFGPGARFNIPFMRNGFVKTINNNVGITFGLDLTFGDGGWGCYNGARNIPGYSCHVTEFWLPVAMQWNFWLTPVISVFGEPGFAIVHRRWSYPYYCNGGMAPLCSSQSFSDTTLDVVFAGGGRFMFSDKVGATVRIGYPMITAGVNILF